MNQLVPLVPGVAKIDIQVSQDEGHAAVWACFPGSPKVFHPHRVGGGEIDSLAIESLVASNELEGEEVWHHNF